MRRPRSSPTQTAPVTAQAPVIPQSPSALAAFSSSVAMLGISASATVPQTKIAEATSRPRVRALEIFDSSLVRTTKVPIMLAMIPIVASATG